ncbi:RNA-binding region RNP-1 domain-containing protein [Dictyostelium discoideum AX4]|uniref:RNA-binding region RNP-1 domain-containing protein n=1 Tax=Dictyostelium discoideum TaxID=44689 RepID=Q54HD0_DICDI|nr:RNA-binding region RNP-1 domain-containing protein [Dictyostelium discoideum AX4]EAL62669.1 RNA-binding region RNP-1 domain-containing protein [Dictyostelium discoideum AX4]|eukprot:XP_636172.1 RNA-binding region RNP-1 domain-containing protein [Dictyostelium discoideum AX4]
MNENKQKTTNTIETKEINPIVPPPPPPITAETTAPAKIQPPPTSTTKANTTTTTTTTTTTKEAASSLSILAPLNLNEIDENKIKFNKDGDKTYFSEKDNTHYIYNTHSKQWLAEITKDMMNSQQSVYQKKVEKRDLTQEQIDNISDLHISGIPMDGSIRELQISNYLKKCGYIKKNEYGRPIISLLVDNENQFTGCALVSFERKESVPIAILQYDETEISPNNIIRIRKATLEESKLHLVNEKSNKKQKKSHKDRRSEYENEAKYGWADSESKTVIIKNLFSPEEAMVDPNFFNDLQADLEDETHGCGKCGPISSIHIFEYNPDGVVSVKFSEFESAKKCVALMNDRFFGGRKLSADFYDGYSNYYVEETDENKEKRLKKWESYINK